MKLENFKKRNEKAVLKKTTLQEIKGGEYGDVDWEFWKRYFCGTPAGATAGSGALQGGANQVP